MEWAYTIGILIVLSFIVLYEWPNFARREKKENVVFMLLMSVNLVLAVFLVYFPETTSPMQVIGKVFQPITENLP